MSKFPKNLESKLKKREKEGALRSLPLKTNLVDFSSNDYLGFATNETIYSDTFKLILKKEASQNGATGSRLLSGNYSLYTELEIYLASFFAVESALVFNSGYDANLGFFSSVPQRGDIIFYDELVHASIRDGILLSNAKSYKFKHNDLDNLQAKVLSLTADWKSGEAEIYIVTESVFSMDGDSPDIKELVRFSRKGGYNLIIDEAHAVGLFGQEGEGLVQENKVQEDVFARIVTFGKAMGCHGAAILGSKKLTEYLVNYARSFIYTTGLPPHSIATIYSAFSFILTDEAKETRKVLESNIGFFIQKVQDLSLKKYFIPSNSAIHSCLIPGNTKVKNVASKIQDKGFNVRPIMSPSVPDGEERLRFCLHSFNSKEEIGLVLQILLANLK
ncbi:8-amino-7-oxononanoate synthase [Saonia flava]|uniref:8-amino-7-oxononanoate synthase n=1 Tax=Saonia flava TaxID=523696 RepID=A0A846QQ89_9FLAO|nr:aminotransferase class I/II-fold pyridoxal phosphate-dependent enzyme [Saonia flava]NJB71206.1 8-amino-7-oxononanoate synthase [Saonia flava]